MKRVRLVFVCGLLLSSVADPRMNFISRAEIVEIPSIEDTAIFEFEPEFNMGGEPDVPVGTLGEQASGTRARGLIRFDVGNFLPANAEIRFALVQFHVVKVPLAPADSPFGLRRLLQDWGEGSGRGGRPGGRPAVTGEANWIHANAQIKEWIIPGGEPSSDFHEESSGQEIVRDEGLYEIELTERGLQDIRDWLADPSTNHGWLLKSEEEHVLQTARRIATRESISMAPVLVVEFNHAGPVLPRIVDLTETEQGWAIDVEVEGGFLYALQAADTLNLVRWETVQTTATPARGGILRLTDESPAGTARFYRIERLAPN